MTLGEILLTNKGRYNKAFIIENDPQTNGPVFKEINEDNIKKDQVQKKAKDYFLLEKEGIDEIFGNGDQLGLENDDRVLIIGV